MSLEGVEFDGKGVLQCQLFGASRKSAFQWACSEVPRVVGCERGFSRLSD